MKKRKRKISKAKLARRERKGKDKAWREAVLARDKLCIICGSGFMTNIHHIIPREVKEFRHDVENGAALCPRHHRFSRECSPHRNSFVFMLWLKDHRPEQFLHIEMKLESLNMLPWLIKKT